MQMKATRLRTTGRGAPKPPYGFKFLTDPDGAYLTDPDGSFLTEAV